MAGDRFVKSAGILVGGTASAQLLAILALPSLTRLYSGEDFSILAIYVAILAMVAALTCMRLDTAIPLPKEEDEAHRLLILALASTVLVTAVLAFSIAFFGDNLVRHMGRADVAPYLWLVPIGAAMMGIYSAFQYMAMRQKAFSLIARTRLTQTLAGLGAQLGFGFAGFAPVGLMIGHALMSGLGVVALALPVLNKGFLNKALLNPEKIRNTLRSYRNFPQYSVAEELLNNAGIQLPIILIGVYIIGPEAGYLFLAMRVVGTPINMIGGAVSQVYYAHAAEYMREGRLAEETAQIVRRISDWIVLPMVFLGPFAPIVFREVFGLDWERAGVLLVWMLPWYAFRLISSPISMVMHVKLQQRLMLYLTLAGLFLRLAPLGIVLTYKSEFASVTYAITSAIFYALISFVFMGIAGMKRHSIITIILIAVTKWTFATKLAFLIIEVFQDEKYF